MNGIDAGAFLPIIAKSGAATIVLALLYGLSHVIREWRGGTVSEKNEEDLQKRITDVEARLGTAEGQITRLTHQVFTMRYQRDQARVRVEFLEQKHGEDPRTVWAPDPLEESHD
ncbi:hypothetical protein GCM10008955_01430 [Deinococcus malanensis]|uniref:Uncharacterized protein n=1 Tax=Deinococcus malanensis TaxID=1706855 RepID=A0ABQ2EL92_9DEIO|nr:hypothetical protein [Deinococcus malanensis]GGK11889.1 hypothetical protein GCM10008955_01430 [Deinococcus malanensis]